MFEVNDALDAIYLGAFFFGILFVVATLVMGSVDIGGHHDHGDLGPFNLSTILGFVAWFGGIGYLVKNGLDGPGILSIIAAILGGLAGAVVVYTLLVKLIAPSDKPLDPKDFELPGTIGRVSSSIRLGGVGEVLFEQQGVRQVSAARSVDGEAIPRGTEVVILRSEHGIAFVQQWESLLAEHAESAPSLATGERTSAART
jgi:hypothetical protein